MGQAFVCPCIYTFEYTRYWSPHEIDPEEFIAEVKPNANFSSVAYKGFHGLHTKYLDAKITFVHENEGCICFVVFCTTRILL